MKKGKEGFPFYLEHGTTVLDEETQEEFTLEGEEVEGEFKDPLGKFQDRVFEGWSLVVPPKDVKAFLKARGNSKPVSVNLGKRKIRILPGSVHPIH